MESTNRRRLDPNDATATEDHELDLLWAVLRPLIIVKTGERSKVRKRGFHTVRLHWPSAIVVLLVLCGRFAVADDSHVIPHRQDVPPNQPYSPVEAQAKMTVPEGFRSSWSPASRTSSTRSR